MNTHSLDLENSNSQLAYIADGDQIGLDLSGSFSIEVWIRPEDISVQGYVCSKWDTNSLRSYAIQILNDGSIRLYVSDDGTFNAGHALGFATAAGTILTGYWKHIAVTFDISTETCIFYINGVAVTTTKTDGTSLGANLYDTSTSFSAGSRYLNGSASGFFDGMIDDLRVWNDVRTPTEISANFRSELVGTEANLVGYWKYNNNYLDETANNNDLTAVNTPVFTRNIGFARDTNSHSLSLLSASSQYLTIPDASCPNLEIPGSQTWIAWVKTTTVVGNARIMSKYLVSDGDYKLLTRNGAEFKFYLNGLTTASVVVSSVPVVVDTWYFVAGVYDSANSKLKIWVNGTKTEVTASGTANDTNAPFRVGADSAGAADIAANFWNGFIDSAMVFNRALSDAEIATLRDSRPTGSESNLIAYWKFDNSFIDETTSNYHLTPVNTPAFTPYVPFMIAMNGWSEIQPAGDVDKLWVNMQADWDASNIIVGAMDGRLYVSTNKGITWTEHQPAGNFNKSWHLFGIDSDGSFMIAGVGINTPGRIYTTNDFGVTWTERRPVGDADRSWALAAVDADGSNIIISDNNYPDGARLWTSSDYGVNWTERRPAGDVNKRWYGVCSDDDGSFLGAGMGAGGNVGRLYFSTDSGANWTERRPAGDVDREWKLITCNHDGSIVMAVSYNTDGRIYISLDSGVTWSEKQPAGNIGTNWIRGSMSRDGSRIVICSYNINLYEIVIGRIYYSGDTGNTWIELQPTGEADRAWESMAMDRYGSVFIGGIYPGRLFRKDNKIADAGFLVNLM